MVTNNSANKIEAQVAARRPKLTKEEAKRRREVSMRRFKITDFVSVAALTVVLIAIQSRFYTAASPDAPSGALFNTFLLYCGALTLQIAFMICATFMRFSNDRFTSEDKNDHLLKGMRYTYFAPFIALAVLLPALFSGVFADTSMSAGSAAGLAIAGIVISIILAPLVSAFILTPLFLIARGMVAVVQGDTSKMHLAVIGLLIAGLTLFILVGTAAVEPEAPFPIGSVQVVLAVLGIPGNYEIVSETALWIVRGIALFYLGVFIYGRFFAKKRAAVATDKK